MSRTHVERVDTSREAHQLTSFALREQLDAAALSASSEETLVDRKSGGAEKRESRRRLSAHRGDVTAEYRSRADAIAAQEQDGASV